MQSGDEATGLITDGRFALIATTTDQACRQQASQYIHTSWVVGVTSRIEITSRDVAKMSEMMECL